MKDIIKEEIISRVIQEANKNGGKINESTIQFISKQVLTEAEILGDNNNNIDQQEEEQVISYKLTDKEIKDEQKALVQIVSSRAKIYNITVIDEDGGNCIMQGELLDLKIKFMFKLNETNGLLIKTNSEAGVQLDKDTLNVLNKLTGYYQNWKETWIQNKLSYYI